MTSNRSPTSPRSTPEEEDEAVEEASLEVGAQAKDNRDREVDFNLKEVSEEKTMEEGLTRAPQKGTLESTPKQRMLTRTTAGIVCEIGHWIRDCPQKKKDENKGEEPKPYGAFSGLSDALLEFYGQAPLAIGNPVIGEMFQGITEVQQDEDTPEQPQEPEYLN